MLAKIGRLKSLALVSMTQPFGHVVDECRSLRKLVLLRSKYDEHLLPLV